MPQAVNVRPTARQPPRVLTHFIFLPVSVPNTKPSSATSLCSANIRSGPMHDPACADVAGRSRQSRPPHASVGPGLADPTETHAVVRCSGHPLRADHRVGARRVLSGLHDEYDLEPVAA
jgi:hypothetical protein